MNDLALKPLGYQQIVGAAAATALTVPAGTCLVLIKPAAQAIRWRDDGTDPTAAIGYPLAVGEELAYKGTPATFKLIEQAVAATIDIVYYAYV